MFTVYILFSENINRFYIGYTSLTMDERLAYHNYNNKSFTNQAKDWKVVWTQTFDSRSDALAFEKKIKKRGAKRFLKL